jgi:hypothetical protein
MELPREVRNARTRLRMISGVLKNRRVVRPDRCPELCPRLHRTASNSTDLPGRNRPGSAANGFAEAILSPETGVRIPVAVLNESPANAGFSRSRGSSDRNACPEVVPRDTMQRQATRAISGHVFKVERKRDLATTQRYLQFKPRRDAARRISEAFRVDSMGPRRFSDQASRVRSQSSGTSSGRRSHRSCSGS